MHFCLIQFPISDCCFVPPAIGCFLFLFAEFILLFWRYSTKIPYIIGYKHKQCWLTKHWNWSMHNSNISKRIKDTLAHKIKHWNLKLISNFQSFYICWLWCIKSLWKCVIVWQDQFHAFKNRFCISCICVISVDFPRGLRDEDSWQVLLRKCQLSSRNSTVKLNAMSTLCQK